MALPLRWGNVPTLAAADRAASSPSCSAERAVGNEQSIPHLFDAVRGVAQASDAADRAAPSLHRAADVRASVSKIATSFKIFRSALRPSLDMLHWAGVFAAGKANVSAWLTRRRLWKNGLITLCPWRTCSLHWAVSGRIDLERASASERSEECPPLALFLLLRLARNGGVNRTPVQAQRR